MQREPETMWGELGEMRARRVTLEDGRYLIFYTFGDEEVAPPGKVEGARAKAGPEAAPVAGEEESV